MELKHQIKKEQSYTVLLIENDSLNSGVSVDLKSEIFALSDEGIKNLIMDISNVKKIDSSGLAAIITANRLWRAKGNFILTGAHDESIKKLIEVGRLDSIFRILPSINDAIEYILQEQEDAGAKL